MRAGASRRSGALSGRTICRSRSVNGTEPDATKRRERSTDASSHSDRGRGGAHRGRTATTTTSTSTTTASVVDTKSWCKAVIDANTRAGTMRNKRFLSIATVRAGAWKKIVDEAVGQRRQVHRARADLDQDGSKASDCVLQEHQGPQLLEEHAARADDAGRRQEDHGLRADPVWDQVHHVSGRLHGSPVLRPGYQQLAARRA